MADSMPADDGIRPSPSAAVWSPQLIVPSTPDGWVPSMAADPDGPLRMLAPSDCTRAPIARLPGAGAAGTVMLGDRERVGQGDCGGGGAGGAGGGRGMGVDRVE